MRAPGCVHQVTVVQRELIATPETLWAVLRRPELYPRWVLGITRLRHADPGWPQAGATLDYTFRWGPLTLRDRATVLECHAARHLRLRWRRGLIGDAIADIRLQPAGGRTQLRLDQLPRGVFGAPRADPLLAAVAVGGTSPRRSDALTAWRGNSRR